MAKIRRETGALPRGFARGGPPPRPPSSAASLLFRNEPTAFPSHSAVIQAVENQDIYQFSVFHKEGVWYYDAPLTLNSEDHSIQDLLAPYWRNRFSIIAYKFDFKQ